MPSNWHVHPSVRLIMQASPGPHAPSHVGKLASPHGVVPGTHSQPPAPAAQIGDSVGHSPQHTGDGGDCGSPHGRTGNVVDVVDGPTVVVGIGGNEVVVVLPVGATNAGRQSSTGRTASSVSGRIWLFVDTAVRASFGP